jgi:hypothetical protein
VGQEYVGWRGIAQQFFQLGHDLIFVKMRAGVEDERTAIIFQDIDANCLKPRARAGDAIPNLV